MKVKVGGKYLATDDTRVTVTSRFKTTVSGRRFCVISPWDYRWEQLVYEDKLRSIRGSKKDKLQ